MPPPGLIRKEGVSPMILGPVANRRSLHLHLAARKDELTICLP